MANGLPISIELTSKEAEAVLWVLSRGQDEIESDILGGNYEPPTRRQARAAISRVQSVRRRITMQSAVFE